MPEDKKPVISSTPSLSPDRQTASEQPQRMHSHLTTQWQAYPGHSSSSAPASSLAAGTQAPWSATPGTGPKRGRPKAPPRPTPPVRPVAIQPAPIAPSASRSTPSYSSYSSSSSSARPPSNSSASGSAQPPDRNLAFYHGPTNLPPEPYGYYSRAGQQGSGQPSRSITERQSERLPDLEARLERLETAVEKYVDHRGERALERSNLPRK